MTNLADQVSELKTLRGDRLRIKKEIETKQAALNDLEPYQEMVSAKVARDQLEEKIGMLESDIRAATEDYYRVTKDKHPLPGIGIRVNHDMLYDLKEVEEWARVNAPAVFKFDKKSFESVAVDLKAPVTVVDIPKGTIATELP